MPELPGPPADYSSEEREAWLRGATTILELLREQQSVMADRYREEYATDEDACGECGAGLIDAMGGPHCPECDT